MQIQLRHLMSGGYKRENIGQLTHYKEKLWKVETRTNGSNGECMSTSTLILFAASLFYPTLACQCTCELTLENI